VLDACTSIAWWWATPLATKDVTKYGTADPEIGHPEIGHIIWYFFNYVLNI
jgi:hypothetical protein